MKQTVKIMLFLNLLFPVAHQLYAGRPSGRLSGMPCAGMPCAGMPCAGMPYAGKPPKLILASVYMKGIDIHQYLVSEKLDGVRAFWDGKNLISRGGKVFSAPEWYTEGFPEQPLDGELWLGRNRFEELLSIVSKKVPEEREWRHVKYMVFEVPKAEGPFTERYKLIVQLLATSTNTFIHPVTQFTLKDHRALMKKLGTVVSAGGEGLMLHRADALYKVGRSNDLLKVKPYMDAEAVVLSHIPGKGKHKGRMGSVQVMMENGIKFRIGTGFSDKERENPPPIGSTITFKYHGNTINHIPKFASFLRVKPSTFERENVLKGGE